MKSDIAAGDLYVRVEDCIELLGLVPRSVREYYVGTTIFSATDEAAASMPEGNRRIRAFPPEPVPLRSKLYRGKEELPADLTLCFADDTKNRDGIDVKFEPQGESDWSRLRKVEVTVASRLFEQLYLGLLGTVVAAPYDAGDNKITIKCGL
jgi:hypothetical protein